MHSKEFIQRMKDRLLEEQSRLHEEIEAVEEQHPDVEDEDDLAVGEEIEEVNHDIAAQLKKDMQNIEAALSRIENGTYGVCSGGGEDIPEARLEVLPGAETCIEHEPV